MSKAVEILVVADSPRQTSQLKSILKRSDFKVTGAGSGQEALEYLRKHKPAVVISDVKAAEMDSHELCRRIKTDGALKDIPVILVNAFCDVKEIIRGLECGADNFIALPYQEQHFLSSIRHALANRELRQSRTAKAGLEVSFAGRKYSLISERAQIVDLLLATYETACRQNQELMRANKEAKKALQTIQSLNANYHMLLEQNVDAIIIVGHDGNVRYVNPAAEVLFGRKAAEFVGHPFEFPLTTGETREVDISGKNGETTVAEMRVVATKWDGDSVYLASLHDVTESVQLREKLNKMSFTDELTGLYNRRGFFRLAERQLKLANRDMQGMLLFFADVDDLKEINDSLGHHAGDVALRDTAAVFRDTFRETDIIARIGGDEFAILALWARQENTASLIARLKKNLKAQNELGQRHYELSISIGVARYDPEKPCSIDELLARADALMYRRKRGQEDS